MASTYLTRTPSSSGNRKTFTLSLWMKRSSTNYETFAGTGLQGGCPGSRGKLAHDHAFQLVEERAHADRTFFFISLDHRQQHLQVSVQGLHSLNLYSYIRNFAPKTFPKFEGLDHVCIEADFCM